ncbi:hypothetical protein [Paenibacillus lautus]|uniref:hypothetical protein n=1 Tax=Paenibacillus lautus TaxID=1401 RepID=UPI003D28448C
MKPSRSGRSFPPQGNLDEGWPTADRQKAPSNLVFGGLAPPRAGLHKGSALCASP